MLPQVVYNEINEYAAQWLRNLISAGYIAPGDVDTRSIADVGDDDYKGYVQVHLFAGIGGWSLAARIAGWPDDRPLWTGSCPCQPFSAAGKRKGTEDARHLWPEMRRLIAACRPDVVAGEQVASKDGRVWLAGVRADLEDMAYEPWAADICAAGTGAPHIRQRIWWLAESDGRKRDGLADGQGCLGNGPSTGWQQGDGVVERRGAAGGLAHHHGQGCSVLEERNGGTITGREIQQRLDTDGRCGIGGLGHPDIGSGGQGRADVRGGDQGSDALAGAGFGGASGAGGLGHAYDARSQGRLDGSGESGSADQRPVGRAGKPGFWSRYDVVHCTDGKARRFESFAQPLVDGLPASLGRVRADVAQALAEEVRAYAAAETSDTGETMRNLWLSLVAQDDGGQAGLQSPAFLLSFLRQLAHQGWPLAQSLPRSGSETEGVGLCSLWSDETFAGSSHRRRLEKQRSGEPANSVHPLSPVLARYAQTAWGEAYAANAAAVFPLAVGAPNRVGRLRAYGNAINPWLAAEVLGAYLDGRSVRVTPVSEMPHDGVFA